MKSWVVAKAHEGKRLDLFLAEQITRQSRSVLQRWIRDGSVLVNSRPAVSHRKLRAGDVVSVEVVDPAPQFLKPEPLALNIVYEDEDLLVVDKPAGLTVHPGSGQKSGTLANALAHYLEGFSAGDWPDPRRPGIVHRLDKGTSGLLVVAKTVQIHRQLSQQFSRREVRKIYLGLVHGTLAGSGTFDLPVGRHPRRRTRMAARAGGRAALTSYKVEKTLDGFTLVRVRPHTGRTHQIRVHFAHAGHPVVGDPTYASRRLRKIESETLGEIGRLFLHATLLEFRHPRSGERLRLRSPLPDDLRQILDRLDDSH